MQALALVDSDKLSELNRSFRPHNVRAEYMQRAGDGTLKYDKVGVKKRFEATWEMLPENDAAVPDDGLGVVAMEALDDGATHTLRLYKEGGGSYTDYTVVCFAERGELVERDSTGYWWGFTLTMEEV